MKMSKKMLSIILALVMAITCVIPVFADTYATSGTCGENVTWEFDVPTRTLTISGEGNMYNFYSYDNVPWETYKEIIKSVIIEEGVTSIGMCAFYNHPALTSVSLSDSVTSIGREAFSYCKSLNSISIPNSITSIGRGVFSFCTSLESVVIPDSVTYISDSAFSHCIALTDVDIPDSVTNIGSLCFGWCSSLKYITIGKGVSQVGSDAFGGCSSLENVYISDLSKWCDIRFDDYNSNPLCCAGNLYANGELVTDLVIPDDVTSIKSSTFYGCDSITSVVFNDNLTSIGYEAFSCCNNLSKVTINENITSIDETAFRHCNSLSEINVDENNETFKSIDGVLFSNNMIALLQYPTQKKDETYSIPDNVLIIKDYAYYNNDYLKNVIIPETVATIGEYTFYDCNGLTSITIPDDVVSIGNDAFGKCHNLDIVVMGSGITSIGKDAFRINDLYYVGTEEQWNAVSIGYNNYFERIHYNCTNPDGHYTLIKVVNPSTCREEGYSEYTCPCGYTLVKDYTYLDHTPGDWNISQYPTCTKPGHKYQRCTGCGVWLNDESIPATGHIAGEWQSIAPTCTESGLEGKCCTSCGELIEGEIIAALGGSHTFGEWEKVDNRQARTCATCGYIEYKVFPGDINGDGYTSAKEARIILQCVAGLREIDEDLLESADVNGDGHISAVDARIVLQMVAGLREPVDGWNMIPYDKSTVDSDAPAVSSLTVSADKTSVTVGEIITITVTLDNKSGISALTTIANYDSSVLKPIEMRSGNLGATVNVNTGVATMASAETFETAGTICTMTFEAIKTGSADVTFDIIEACDSEMSDINLNVNTVNINVVEESTTEPDEPSTEPDYPDDPTEPEDPCAKGHKWSTWAAEKVAECKKDGFKARNCTVCGEKETEVILATGICAYKWIVTKEATATEYGEKALKCTMCGHVKVTQKLAPTNPCANGHNYTSTVTAPTCTEQGYTTYTCTKCGDKYKDDYTSATGHNYTWYTISVVTCETDGVMLGECTVCGATDVKATLKTGHNIVDGVCQNCGYTENGENDNTNTDDNENVGNEDNNNEEVTDPSDNCSCNCHKSGISNFFFKIGLFFQKIFGSNKYCGCGVAHY